MNLTRFSLLFTIFVGVTLVVVTKVIGWEVVPASFMADEIGYGANGVMNYLHHLVEGTNNVGDLNQWVAFMEKFLACEDVAWPYQSDEEKNAKTDSQLLQEFCNAWQNRWECGNQLAQKMDTLFKQEHSESDVGSKALKFSDSYVQLLCQRRNDFSGLKTLTCYEQSRARIVKCIEQESHVLEKKYQMCKNIVIVQQCFNQGLQESCPKTMDWVNKVVTRIQIDQNCQVSMSNF